jgi:hypothetical protein
VSVSTQAIDLRVNSARDFTTAERAENRIGSPAATLAVRRIRHQVGELRPRPPTVAAGGRRAMTSRA